MFEDSLVESGGTLSRGNPWTAALSFLLQGLGAGLLVLLSLIYTEALPWQSLTSILSEPLPPPPSRPLAAAHAHGAHPRPLLQDTALRVPSSIPKQIAMLHDEAANADASEVPNLLGVPGGTGSNSANTVITNLIQTPPAVAMGVVPSKVRVSSGVVQGLLIYQTRPVYPTLARQARIQGTVVLQATIAKDGTVQDLRAVSGHPLLVKSALDAVKLWRYRPYRLGDQPVDVDTQIVVNFTLNAGN